VAVDGGLATPGIHSTAQRLVEPVRKKGNQLVPQPYFVEGLGLAVAIDGGVATPRVDSAAQRLVEPVTNRF